MNIYYLLDPSGGQLETILRKRQIHLCNYTTDGIAGVYLTEAPPFLGPAPSQLLEIGLPAQIAISQFGTYQRGWIVPAEVINHYETIRRLSLEEWKEAWLKWECHYYLKAIKAAIPISALSPKTRARLKLLYADPDPGRWDWDDGMWDWELSIRDKTHDDDDDDAGYIAIIPIENGKPLEHGKQPASRHSEWAIKFVVTIDDGVDDMISVRGTLAEVKHHLDNLLAFATPQFSPT